MSESGVVVLQSFVGNLDGADLHFKAGDLFPADDKAAKKWPHLFGPSQPSLEQATAGPGEKRGIRLRRSAKAPKATAAQEVGMAHQLKVEAADAMPEPKPIPKPIPEPAPAGKAITTASFEGK
jgi:predicted component of type VI protein secretion system